MLKTGHITFSMIQKKRKKGDQEVNVIDLLQQNKNNTKKGVQDANVTDLLQQNEKNTKKKRSRC